MKYSILIPYYNRPTLNDTLASFVKLYSNRDDFEVVIVEAFKNRIGYNYTSGAKVLHDIIDKYKTQLKINYRYNNEDHTNSCCVNYNKAAMLANGKYFILTNPETKHETDILKGIDQEVDIKDCYVVCACQSIREDGTWYMWYQHSQHNNRLLHFCSCISAKNYWKINGFCELYAKGVAFEDDDFLKRIKTLNIPIVTRDDLVVSHLEHERGYLSRDLIETNLNTFNFIWDEHRSL